jgi:hypothetical protein
LEAGLPRQPVGNILLSPTPVLHQIDRTKPERYLLQEAEKYHQYVIRLARYAMPHAARLPEFQAIDKEAEFAVRVGDFTALMRIFLFGIVSAKPFNSANALCERTNCFKITLVSKSMSGGNGFKLYSDMAIAP